MNSDSESPPEKPVAPNTGSEPSVQAKQGNIDVPITPSIPTTPPAKSHYQITCKTEKTFWDKFKDGAEIVGICLLAVYTWYSIKMYCANKQAADAARDAAKAAQDSITLARKNAHFDQRAWLGVSFAPYKSVLAKPLGMVVHVVDTGKTPARNAHGDFATVFLRKSDPFRGFESNHGTSVEFGTMMQGTEDTISWLVDPDAPKEIKTLPKVSPSMQIALAGGNGYLMIFGKIEYDSAFGAHHWIKVCGTSEQAKFTLPKECADYNDVDGNDEP
jgi:hypothetical protein